MANDPDASPPPEPEPDPPEPRRSPINPFEAALKRSATPDIRVAWSVHDMQLLRPDWTAEQCEAFMLRHVRTFAASMIRMGLALLAQMADDPKFTTGISAASNNGNGGKHPPPLPPSPQNN